MWERVQGIVFLVALVGAAFAIGFGKGAFRDFLNKNRPPHQVSPVTLSPAPRVLEMQVAELRQEVEELRSGFYKDYIATLSLSSHHFSTLKTPIGNFMVRIKKVWKLDQNMVVEIELGNPHDIALKKATLLTSWKRNNREPINYAGAVDVLPSGGSWTMSLLFKPEYGVTSNSTVQVALKLDEVQLGAATP